MRKLIFIIAILFIFVNNNIKCEHLSFINYSISYEIQEDENIVNHSIGYDFLFFPNEKGWSSGFGFLFKGINNGLNINLNYFVYFWPWGMDFPIKTRSLVLTNIGLGTNGLYNFTNNIFGISPEINFSIQIEFLKFIFLYRYNIYLNNKYSHEFGLTISIFNILSVLSWNF